VNNETSIIQLLKKLSFHINARRKKSLILLMVLILIASISELISFGTFLPFLNVLSNPEQVFKIKSLNPLIKLMNINYPRELILPITLLFIFSAIFSGIIRILLNWYQIKISFNIGNDISSDIYNNALHDSYETHISRNSSVIIDGVRVKANSVVNYIIIPFLTILSSLFLFTTIVSILFYINYRMTILTFGGFFIIYFLFSRFTKKKLTKDSLTVSQKSIDVIKSLQEGLGGIRDVLLNGTQEVYLKIFKKADLELRIAEARISIISISPRFGSETIGIVLLSLISYYLTLNSNFQIINLLPTLGLLALGAQRLLPLIQQTYSSYATIVGSKKALSEALFLLENKRTTLNLNTSSVNINLQNKIELKDLSFKYTGSKNFALKNINIKFDKGSITGIIGSSGSGKSTLLDILMSLLHPTSGSFYVDETEINSTNFKTWQQNIAHVPQFIYLSDATIAENIAFGVPKNLINYDLVKLAAEKSRISDIIEKLDKKYETIIGENGSRLSGGQRQRIGIARALYKNAKILIFDEATSSLDNEIENEVMNSIENLGNEYTIIIVAHRTSTLKKCNQIIELKNGELNKITNFNQITLNNYE
jgi:ATP-binding cassette subfamily B protein